MTIHNFTNTHYITDGCLNTVRHMMLNGSDGYHGIKLYAHACDNLLSDIEIRSNFADIAGGEGNVYGNVLTYIRYTKPYFHPTDFDFHGFAEAR